jgi:hypothetical protein
MTFIKFFKKIKYALTFLLCISCIGLSIFAANFLDNSLATFAGTHSGTYWNNVDAVELTTPGITAGSGTYTSEIMDGGGSNAVWNSFNWVPKAAVDKPLPDNRGSETVYTANNAVMTSNNLLMHMDESSGTTIADTSSRNNTGTVAGGVTYGASGIYNNALTFDGVNGEVLIPNSSTLNPTNRFTMEAWMYWNINPATGNGWGNIASKNGDSGYRLQHNSNNSAFEFGLVTNNSNSLTTGTTAPQQGKWYYLVGTYDGSNIRLYVNGQLEATAATTGNVVSSTTPLNIGSFKVNPGDPSTRFLNGKIDELALYTRALSATEITARFSRGINDLDFQVRSCSNSTCSGTPWQGPDGTASTYFRDTVQNVLPTFTFSNVANNQYFQYQMIFTNLDPAHTAGISARVKSVNVNYTAGTSTISLGLAIRNTADTANVNTCDLGTANPTAVATCSYALKVTSSATNGYIVSVQTDGGLTNGTYAISNAGAGTGGAGGNLIDNTTAGAEVYGIFVSTGSLSSGGSISRKAAFNGSGSNSVLANYVSSTQMVESFGQNLPAATDPTRNITVTHNLNISGSTPAESYTQKIIYTVTPKF